jgi:alpha-beta hydrolase superfamily lysophospholipase
MSIKVGRLEFLAPHLLRSQILRPDFVRLSLWLGAARHLPAWARLLFVDAGVSPADLDLVLRRVTSLESWVREWEWLGLRHEAAGHADLATGERAGAAAHFLAATAAFNFAQHVLFLDIVRKRGLHGAGTRAYEQAAPLLDPPARSFEVVYRRRVVKGWLRVPRGVRRAPVVVLFHGTNGVKEELHGWSEALLDRGLATITLDGPGLGQTFHRLSMVAEPRPVWAAIYRAIEAEPALDPGAVALFGNSLGAFLAIRMAAHDPRVRAVAAVSPPYSVAVYWNVTLAGMRRELAALYDASEDEMGRVAERMTLSRVLPGLRAPLFVAGGGHDLITPGEEARRIFDRARCERQLVFYPQGAHDCFNVLADLRPRVAGWFADRLSPDRTRPIVHARAIAGPPPRQPAEAVNADSAEALRDETNRGIERRGAAAPERARRTWWQRTPQEHVEVRSRAAGS